MQPSFKYFVGLIDKDKKWRVSFNPNTKMISCSCQKFEMTELLYYHVVKIYNVMDVKTISHHYILNRWANNSRSRVVQDYMGNEFEDDLKLQSTKQCRKLCMMLV